MKKKLIMTILCASMLATLVTACGSSSKGNSTKTETSKKETVSVEKEDIEKEDNQPETVEENYSYNSFWKDFKILADGNEIILGETTLQDMENLGFYVRKDGTVIKNDNSSMKVEANCRKEDDNWDDFSLRIIFSMELNGDSGNVSLGGITPNSSPEEIFQTVGIPDYYDGKDNLEYTDWDSYHWIYINKDIVLEFTFYLCNDEDNDLVINVYGGDMGKSESEYYTENRISEGLECGEENFRKLYPSYFGEDSVEQEAPVASDDKTITIEGKQITFKETTVEEILAMFPEMEYRPYSLSRYQDNDELSSYDFFLENENISMMIYGRDFEAEERARERECNSSNTIMLEGNEPDIDLSKVKVLRIDFINAALIQEISNINTIADNDNLNISEEIKNSLILFNGVKIGMTEEEVLELYPNLSVSQESGFFVVYDAELNQESRMKYRLIFRNNSSHKDELKNTERRLTEIDIVIW